MTEVSHTFTLNIHECYVCNIHFAIPATFEKNRRDDGKPFYCPNRHELKWPGIAPRAELKKELDAAEQRIAVLNSQKTALLAKLDQSEAMLIENGIAQKTEDPPKDEAA